MGEKDFDITPADTDKDLPDEPEFDITPDSAEETTDEPTFDITPAESEPEKGASAPDMPDTADEEGSEPEATEADPLSVQPEWYDNVRKDLPSRSTGKTEAYKFPVEESEPEATEADPLSVQPEWFYKIREGLPSKGGRAAKYEPYQFRSDNETKQEDRGIDGRGREKGKIFVSKDHLKSEYDVPEQMREEAERIVAEMPEEERESAMRGFLGLGYDVQKIKGKTLSKMFVWAAEKFGTRKIEGELEQKPFVKRLLESYGEMYGAIADRARADRERFDKEGGAKGITKSAALAAANMVTLGRAVAGYGTPIGTIAVAAVVLGKGGEAVKEAHLKSEDVIEEGRLHDIDAAEEEAWKLYEEAKEKSGDEAVTKEQLIQTYKERLPRDLAERLARDAGTDGFGARAAQKVARWSIERSARKIQNKLNEIENDAALSREQKKKKIAGVIGKYEQFLKDMDRMVRNSGTVDMIAYGGRLVEKGGKALPVLVAAETVAELAWRGAEALEVLGERGEEAADVAGEATTSIESAHNAPPEGEILLGEEAEAMLRESQERLTDFELKEKLSAFDLTMDDLAESELTTVELEALVDGVGAGEFGGNAKDVILFLAHTPDAAEKLNDDAVRSLLSNETMSAERVRDIVDAESVAVVGKGESISEVLGIDTAPDMKVTVVNPDGTELEDFDANLVHQGDTIVRNADGTITVFKTSDIEVSPEHSLQGVYDSIKQGLDEKGIPAEVQNALNQGEGHWEGQISRAEASAIEETWNSLKTDFDTLDEEGKKAFLGKLSKGMTEEEMSRALHEQLASGQELPTEELPPDIMEQFTAAEGRKAAAETLEKAYTPDEIERARIPGEPKWPPVDGKTPEQRIAPDAWSESVKKGERYEIHDDALDEDIEMKEQTPKTPVRSETDIPETILKTGDNEYIYNGPAGDFKGKFSYNENNEITGFRHEGSTKMGGTGELENSVLKEGWREKLLGRKGGAYLAEQKIKTTAHDLGIRQRMLTAMEKTGDKDTKEYQFLKKTIATRIELAEKKYGDIFK